MASRGSERQGEGRPAAEGDTLASRDEEYAVRPVQDRGESVGDPDVQLDVPALRVEELDLEVDDLQARVSVRAELSDLASINIGLDVDLGEVKLQIKGIEAEAHLKARLDNVRAIFSEVLASLQHNPQFFRQTLAQADQRTEIPGATGDNSGSRHNRDDEQRGHPEATNAARKRAGELGINLSGLEGTGSGGRILVRDVIKAARG